VTRPQIIGNNDIETFAKSLGFGKTEDPFRTAVPQANHALGIGKDDRVRRLSDERQAETVEIDWEAHYFTSSPPADPSYPSIDAWRCQRHRHFRRVDPP
jgi:hypothetical protein